MPSGQPATAVWLRRAGAWRPDSGGKPSRLKVELIDRDRSGPMVEAELEQRTNFWRTLRVKCAPVPGDTQSHGRYSLLNSGSFPRRVQTWSPAASRGIPHVRRWKNFWYPAAAGYDGQLAKGQRFRRRKWGSVMAQRELPGGQCCTLCALQVEDYLLYQNPIPSGFCSHGNRMARPDRMISCGRVASWPTAKVTEPAQCDQHPTASKNASLTLAHTSGWCWSVT